MASLFRSLAITALPQSRRSGSIISKRWSSSTPQEAENPHRNFYKSFGSPVFKVFLGALFTFQVTYWGWLKLESVEVMENKNAEMAELQKKILNVVPTSDSK